MRKGFSQPNYFFRLSLRGIHLELAKLKDVGYTKSSVFSADAFIRVQKKKL
jgi:hypothetical protein